MAESRLLGADFVRTCACLTVMFHHLAQRMSWDRSFGAIDGFRVFAQIGPFGVAMFFVLSGYLLARPFWSALDAGKPMPSLVVYAKRRAARILPGFWLALTVTFILTVTVFGVPLTGELAQRYLSGLFLVADWHWVTFFPVEINGPLWSISFEITSYVLLPLGLIALFGARRFIGSGWAARLFWLVVIAAALGAHLLFMRYYPIDNARRGWDFGLIGGAKWWMPRYNPFSFFAMFAIGSLAAGVQLRLARFRNRAFDAAVLATLALLVWLFHLQMSADDASGFGWLDIPYGFPWFVLATGLLLVVTPSSVAAGYILDNPVVRFIAQISFGIYVWHYVVLELVHLYIVPDFNQGSVSDVPRYVLTCLAIAGTTGVIAWLSFRFVERPFIEMARGPRRSEETETPTLSPAAG